VAALPATTVDVRRRSSLRVHFLGFFSSHLTSLILQGGSYNDTEEVPTPKVFIDQDSDPDATIVEITFGDRLGALLDTVSNFHPLSLSLARVHLLIFLPADESAEEPRAERGQGERVPRLIRQAQHIRHHESVNLLRVLRACARWVRRAENDENFYQVHWS